MLKTRIDFITNGVTNTFLGLIKTKIVAHGIWQMDRETGKHLCLIEIEIPEKGITMNFTPSDAFQNELISRWLEAELDNDNFIFSKPVLNHKRPSQLKSKIDKLEHILNNWRGKLL